MIEWLEKSTKPVGRLLGEDGWQTFLVVNMNEQNPKPRTMIYNNHPELSDEKRFSDGWSDWNGFTHYAAINLP